MSAVDLFTEEAAKKWRMERAAERQQKPRAAHPATLSSFAESKSNEWHIVVSVLYRMWSEAPEISVAERARARARALARQQGVKPIRSIDDLQGDFWPQEESTDEFLAWLRSTRQEGTQRNLPE